MFGISQFFKRIQDAHGQELYLRTIVRDSVKKHLSMDIPLTSISFKSNTITIAHISQAARSTLFIRKQAILQEINSLGLKKVFTDLR